MKWIEKIRNMRNIVKLFLLLLLVLVGLLMPQKKTFPDSDTVCYQAGLYQIMNYNQKSVQNHQLGVISGTEIKILGFTVHDSVQFTANPAGTISASGE